MAYKHGYYKEPWYNSYRSMMDRCYRESAANYKYYGGRGIDVCEEWHDINSFKDWIATSEYQPGLTLDRIDSNQGYTPSNCRWASMKQQDNNRRNTKFVELDGTRHTITEWAEITGINRSTLNNRVHRGWGASEALERGVIYG